MIIENRNDYIFRKEFIVEIRFFRKKMSICTVENVQTGHFDTNKPLAHFLNKVA